MPVATAISLTYTPRDEKRVLLLFSCAFIPGEMRPSQESGLAAPRGILVDANDQD